MNTKANATSTPLPISQGGTGQTTAAAAVNALLPPQLGKTQQFLTTNGTDVSWGLPTLVAATQIPRTTLPLGIIDLGIIGKRAAITESVTIPARIFKAGDIFGFYNDSDEDLSIDEGIELVLRLDGTPNHGDRVLKSRGICTIWFNSETEAIITGNSVS